MPELPSRWGPPGWLLPPPRTLSPEELRRACDPVANAKAAARLYAEGYRPVEVKAEVRVVNGIPMAEAVAEMASRWGLSVTSSQRGAARPSPPPQRGVHAAGPFGLFVWPEAYRPGPPPPVPAPSGSFHYGRPVIDFKTPLRPVTVRRIRNMFLVSHLGLTWRTKLLDVRRRGKAMGEALEDVSWPWPVWDSSWTRRRIFDHERDWWQ